MLIDGYKFDLRIYVLVSSVDPLRIYIYREGLARFATELFKIEKNKVFDNFTHLTNFSVNKKNSKFYIDDKNGRGFKWTLAQLKAKLQKMGINHEKIFCDIDDVVVKTVLSIEQKLFSASEKYLKYRNNCFELLGFDILIDSDLKPWLLEVNLAPSLSCKSPLDLRIKSDLIKDVFNLVGVYPKLTKKDSIYKSNLNLTIYNTHRVLGSRGFEKNQERDVLMESKEEIRRSGEFKLIYPSYNCWYYRQFFEQNRKNNSFLIKK